MRPGRIGVLAAAVALLSGCGPFLPLFGGGWTAYAPKGPPVVVHHMVRVVQAPIPVTLGGEIGPLQVGLSTAGDVIGFLGRPKAMNTDYATAQRGFQALGYGDCKHTWATKDGTPDCTTVFYFPTHTGKLALMWTTSSRYAFRGIHVGVPARSATRIFHRPPGSGCLTTWGFKGKSAFVVVGVIGRGSGRVGYLVVHAEPPTKSNTLGALDCSEG